MKKYLIDTSLVPAAIGESTPAHVAHFKQATSDGALWSSVYVRKEFIHRWVLPCFEMAACVKQYDNLADALNYLTQDFSGRNVKARTDILAAILREKGSLRNTRETAVEIARIGILMLRKFDASLAPKIKNLSGCKIGGASCSIDFNHLFDDLRSFAERVGVVFDCPINEYLGFAKPRGHAAKLLAGNSVDSTKSGSALRKLLDNKTHVTCKECKKIGDAVIVMEQPSLWHLISSDKDFPTLCAALERPMKTILSVRGLDKASREESESNSMDGTQ